MLTVCYSVKGGQGCTTVAAGLAGRPVMVVDPAGDVPAVLGVPEPSGPGVLDVLSSRRPVRVEALRAVAVDAAPAAEHGSDDDTDDPDHGPGDDSRIERDSDGGDPSQKPDDEWAGTGADAAEGLDGEIDGSVT